MWLEATLQRKWRSDSIEARIYAAAEANALANESEDPDSEAMEAVFKVMSWLYRGSYAVAVDLIKEAFGVETSVAALSGFWDRFCSPYLSEHMRRSSAAAQNLKGVLDTEGVKEASIDLIAQQTFEILSNPNPDSEEVVKLAKIILQADKQDTDKRRVRLLEEAAEQKLKAKEVLGSGLSQEEQNRRIREILK